MQKVRALVLTSFAFILGLLPPVGVNGASEQAGRDVGTPVFGAMILASFVGIFEETLIEEGCCARVIGA